MPVRCIKRIYIEEHDYHTQVFILFPFAIKNAIEVSTADIFVCEFKRLFDRNKDLIKEINETEKIDGLYDLNCSEPRFNLKRCDITKKFGLCEGEFIEIIFKEIERTEKWKEGIIFKKIKSKTETIPIFPERTIEDLDFIPK
jgi:hypothetical protein